MFCMKIVTKSFIVYISEILNTLIWCYVVDGKIIIVKFLYEQKNLDDILYRIRIRLRTTKSFNTI